MQLRNLPTVKDVVRSLSNQPQISGLRAPTSTSRACVEGRRGAAEPYVSPTGAAPPAPNNLKGLRTGPKHWVRAARVPPASTTTASAVAH